MPPPFARHDAPPPVEGLAPLALPWRARAEQWCHDRVVEPARARPGLTLVIGMAALALVVGAVLVLRPISAGPPDAQLPYAAGAATTAVRSATGASAGTASAATPTAAPSTTAGRAVVVHVAGAVVRPGVYRLAEGARVIDATEAAGGLTASADVVRVNLAARLVDGGRVYVPAVGEAVPAVEAGGGGTADAASVAPSGPLDLNQATAEQLDALPGVGPATAANIIAHRRDHGPFRSVDDLLSVPGIGPAKLAQLRSSVTV